MAHTLQFLLLFPLIFFINFTFSQRPIFPNSIVIPVTKDSSTNQYISKLHIGGSQEQVNLVLDINSPFLWVDCVSYDTISRRRAIKSSSLQCSMAPNTTINGFTADENKICRLQTTNTIKKMTSLGDLTEDVLSVEFRDGTSNGAFVSIHHFLFSCAPNMLLQGLASGVQGMLGFGKNSRISLPSQLSTRFGFQRKFAMCLSSSSNGVILGGDGPYGDIISKSLMYTPLSSNQEDHYYINVKSIKVNGVKIPLNSSLFSLDEKGNKGTKISTIVPYTTMESTIYEAFVKAYVEVANNMNMARVAHVGPFEICYNLVGLNNVPIIDFVLQSEMVKWRVHGGNSMVKVNDEVMCLGFLNGGLNQKASIVIGGYQLEENLLEFNFGTSMLGFGSMLMGKKSCSDFGIGGVALD